MSSIRNHAAAIIKIQVSLGLLCAVACGTDAAGVEACRTIESARCSAAANCEVQFAISDVGSCQRFYDAQCLHGFASSDAPGTPEVNACVATINAAGKCALDGGEQAVCDELGPDLTRASTACEVIAHPERASTCAFLASTPDPADDNQSNSAGSSGAIEAAGGHGGIAAGGAGGTPGTAD